MCKTMENSSESVNTFDKAKNSASGLLSRSVTSAKATLKSRIPIVKTKKQEESSTCRVSTKDKKTVDLKIESVKGASTVQNNFVKSSDMKKMLSKLFFQERVSAQDRMSRSIPEMSWFDMKVLSGSANGRSLSRIFPCLTASVLSRTSSDADFTTASISSIGTQNTDSNLATSLGADLLRMFLEEIGTDVVIEVAGRRIRAHECILSSRCVFFAGELSGERDESAGNNCIISLPGFSYEIVHFVIYNIYSGVNTIPDNIDMTELCRFTHHISLQGLNDAIEFKLKSEYCHFFHEPCVECSSRALECLMLAEQYELDEIYRESIQWINKHYIKIWTHEPFLSISSSLLHKLLIHHLHNQLNVDNIRDTLMNCDKMLSKMRGFRWEKVVDIVRKLRDGTIKYASENVSSLLNDDSWFELDGDLRQKILMLSTNTKPTNLNARMKCTPWKQSFDEKVIPMAPIQLLQHKELVKKLQYNQGNARN